MMADNKTAKKMKFIPNPKFKSLDVVYKGKRVSLANDKPYSMEIAATKTKPKGTVVVEGMAKNQEVLEYFYKLGMKKEILEVEDK